MTSSMKEMQLGPESSDALDHARQYVEELGKHVKDVTVEQFQDTKGLLQVGYDSEGFHVFDPNEVANALRKNPEMLKKYKLDGLNVCAALRAFHSNSYV